jgi:hypothetical protein
VVILVFDYQILGVGNINEGKAEKSHSEKKEGSTFLS